MMASVLTAAPKLRPGGNAADHAGLGGQRQQVDDLLLGGDAGDALGHADAEVDDAVGLQLEARRGGR
jgi:hypothetical protein